MNRPSDQPESESGPPPVYEGGLDVVIAHDFVEAYGGAERVLAEILATFPDSPLWVVAGRRSLAERIGASGRFNLLVPDRSWLVGRYRSLAPVYPLLTGVRRLPAADVLLTSSFAYAHRLKTSNRAPQVCLCHGPLRFAWTQTDAYSQRWAPGPIRARAFRAFAASARRGDRRAAAGVDRYLVFSEYVERQIREFYRREATRIRPPLDCETFRPGSSAREGFYLFCGRLAEPSKQPTIAVEAFRSLPGERLLVAGDGPALPALRESPPPNVEFLGHLTDHELVPLMQRCEATVFPSREDLGLIPLEANACGRPVLAYAGGGALETVAAGVTGEFFGYQTAECVAEAVRAFDPDAYDPGEIRAHALQWDRRHFRRAVIQEVEAAAKDGPR